MEKVSRSISIMISLLKHLFSLQIDGETVEAQIKANETAAKVDQLSEELNKLQKNVLKNEFDAKEIKSQSDIVRGTANNAHEGAIKV